MKEKHTQPMVYNSTYLTELEISAEEWYTRGLLVDRNLFQKNCAHKLSPVSLLQMHLFSMS
jgi:hypothetical protein